MECPRWAQFFGPYYGIDYVHEASEDEKSHKCNRLCSVPSAYKHGGYLKQRFLDKFLNQRGIRKATNDQPRSPKGTIARSTGVLEMFFFKNGDAMGEFNRVLDAMADEIDAAIGGSWLLCGINVDITENVVDKMVTMDLTVEYKQ